jgi:hypothetical protein
MEAPMSVFVDTVAGRAGTLWQHGIAAIGFHLRREVAARPVPRGPAIDSEVMKLLEEAARSVGKLDWSRRYYEIMQSRAGTPPV